MEIKKKIIFFVASLFLVSLVYALDPPPSLPDHFKGDLVIDEQDADIGTEIEIYVNDGLKSTITTTIIGEYDLYVKTGNYRDEIKFKVNDIEAATYERQGGETINLDLVVYTDRDNDGINDSTDTLIGDKESIENNYDSLDVYIDDSGNTTGSFSGTKKVEIKNNGETIVEFDFDFDENTLNLYNINITRQTNSTEGSIVVRGIPSGLTKTVYVDRLDADNNAVCVKDSEISSISELTADCTGTEETELSCPSSGTYTCSIENNRFKVSGLSHSGVKGFYIAPPETPPSGGSSSGGGSSGGGSSGGGGGGVGAKSCYNEWQCGEWSDCEEETQKRSCEYATLDKPKPTTTGSCPKKSVPPKTERACEIPKEAAPETEEIKEAEKTTPILTTAEEPAATGGLREITGTFIEELFSTKERNLWLDLPLIVIIITIVFQVRAYYKKKPEAGNIRAKY